MKTLVLMLLFVSICQNSLCQEKVLSIVNQTLSKEVLLKEHRRIKLVTKLGEKYEGKFRILNSNTIKVNGVIIGLNEISIIRKNPLALTILIKANFFHMGTVGLFFSALLSGFSENVSFVLVGVGILASGIYGGIKSPNIKKGYKVSDNWKFAITTGKKGVKEPNIK
ncbi:hypothetical protein ACU8V7_10720 [Zobellia nedashkovskayae]